jgi:hypothetical protein
MLVAGAVYGKRRLKNLPAMTASGSNRPKNSFANFGLLHRIEVV